MALLAVPYRFFALLRLVHVKNQLASVAADEHHSNVIAIVEEKDVAKCLLSCCLQGACKQIALGAHVTVSFYVVEQFFHLIT